MKRMIITGILILLVTAPLTAQTSTSVLTWYARSDRDTLRLAEVWQTRGRWIVPDVMVLDFGTRAYGEAFIGGGYVTIDGKRFTLVNELFYVQTHGTASNGERYIAPLVNATYRITPTLKLNAAGLYYVPLTREGTRQLVIDRARFVQTFGPVGVTAGYAGYWSEGRKALGGSFAGQINDKPFAGIVLSTRLGSTEVWYQKLDPRLADGERGQVYFRHVYTFK